MNTRIILFLLIVTASIHADDSYKRWWEAGDSWYSRWMNLADESSSMQPEENFDYLEVLSE